MVVKNASTTCDSRGDGYVVHICDGVNQNGDAKHTITALTLRRSYVLCCFDSSLLRFVNVMDLIVMLLLHASFLITKEKNNLLKNHQLRVDRMGMRDNVPPCRHILVLLVIYYFFCVQQRSGVAALFIKCIHIHGHTRTRTHYGHTHEHTEYFSLVK